MIREAATIVVGLIALVFGIAGGIYAYFGGDGTAAYGNYVMYVSVGLGMIAGAFVNGPTASSLEVSQSHFDSDIAKHDRADRDSALSLGLVIFLAAILAGAGGYLLTRF